MLRIFRFNAQMITAINSKLTISNTEYGLILSGILGIFLFLFGPALYAEFYIIEDHQLVDGRLMGISDLFNRIVGDINAFQRFRPGYWLYITLGGKLFGTNPHLWHAAAILWGVVTCFLFYITLRKIGADIASSTVFVLLILLSGNQNWVWLNLIPQETIGMLFTAIAVWAVVIASQKRASSPWDILGLVAMASAGLVKESFVVLIPAILMLRLICQKRGADETWLEVIGKLRLPLASGAVIFVIQIVVVMSVFMSNLEGYSATASGVSWESISFMRYLKIFSALTLSWKLIIVAGMIIWLYLLLYKKHARPFLYGGSVTFVAWIVPQVVLYSNGLNERYLFPAIVGIAAAIGLGLSLLLRDRRLWPLWIVGVLALSPILAKGVSSTTTTVGAFVADTVAVNRMVEFIAQNTPSDRTILMVGDSGTAYGFEATYSLPIYLRIAGSTSPFYLWPITSKGERSAMHISASNNNMAFHFPDHLVPHEVGAIIIVDKWIPTFDYKSLAQWLGHTAWRDINFIEPYYSFSFRNVGFIKAGEVIHKILLPPFVGSLPSPRPLIVIEPSLTGVVSASTWLDSPPWGLEKDYAGPGSIVWLGEGDEEGLAGVLSSTREQSVNIELEVVLGPSRSDDRRTIEFSLDNRGGQQMHREVFQGGKWKFNLTLQPGENHFRLRILDKATISVQPNGDTRRLLALLRRMSVSSLVTD